MTNAFLLVFCYVHNRNLGVVWQLKCVYLCHNFFFNSFIIIVTDLRKSLVNIIFMIHQYRFFIFRIATLKFIFDVYFHLLRTLFRVITSFRNTLKERETCSLSLSSCLKYIYNGLSKIQRQLKISVKNTEKKNKNHCKFILDLG